MKINLITLICALFVNTFSYAQTLTLEPMPFGDMDNWLVRSVKESFVIGGGTKQIYEVAKQRTIEENTPYIAVGSPWATSSVYAKVSGVTKGSSTVFYEEREDNGKCARLETCLEKVKVLGVINISALATGTIFTGEIVEPIRDTKDPQAKLMSGIPFTKSPKALVFDYKVSPASERIYDNGLSRRRTLEGKNAAEAVVILQYRWEDENGNIFAKRVATGWERYSEDVTEWQNGHQLEIVYGDITQNANFEPYMGLLVDDPIYAKNSKGEPKMINETGWAEIGTQPTHIFIRFSSGYGGAYVGSIGSKFWIDNIQLGY